MTGVQTCALPIYIRGLVQIAAAHADDEVALFGVLPDPGGGTLEAVHHDAAGQLR